MSDRLQGHNLCAGYCPICLRRVHGTASSMRVRGPRVNGALRRQDSVIAGRPVWDVGHCTGCTQCVPSPAAGFLGHCALDIVHWALGAEHLTLVFDPGYLALETNGWALHAVRWTLGAGLWVLDSGC